MGIFGKKQAKNSGFTIVELATIIAVIGILAAIVIVGYGNWHESVAKKQVQSDLNQVKSAMENERNFGNGYPTSLPSTFTPSDGVQVTYAFGDATTYCVNAQSTVVTSVKYHLDSSNGTPQEGTCDDGGGSAPTVPGPTLAGNRNGTAVYSSWNAVASSTGYQLRWQKDGGAWTTVEIAGGTLAYYHSGITATSTYTYQVRAEFSDGTYSDWSNARTYAP